MFVGFGKLLVAPAAFDVAACMFSILRILRTAGRAMSDFAFLLMLG